MKKKKVDLGEAISFEDALALLTVIFVVFFCLMLPLVSVDKSKVKVDELDVFWMKAYDWIKRNPSPERLVSPYRDAFDLNGYKVYYEKKGSSTRYIEASSPDSVLQIIEHNTKKQTFLIVHVDIPNDIKYYSSGTLRWENIGREWFTEQSQVFYKSSTASKELEAYYRKVVTQRKGL